MNKKFRDVKAKAEKDPAFLAKLIVNPKRALTDAGLELSEPADVKRTELFVKIAQEQLRAAGRVVGISAVTASWGIGAWCCNSNKLIVRRP